MSVADGFRVCVASFCGQRLQSDQDTMPSKRGTKGGMGSSVKETTEWWGSSFYAQLLSYVLTQPEAQRRHWLTKLRKLCHELEDVQSGALDVTTMVEEERRIYLTEEEVQQLATTGEADMEQTPLLS